MNKEQQLTFNLGITNVPSDTICDDNALEESMNLVHDGNETRPIQKPVLSMRVELHDGVAITEVLFIHKVGSKERYIVRLSDNNIAWGVKEMDNVSGDYCYVGKGTLLQIEESVQVQVIGKTVIALADGDLNYFLWKDDGYKYLGNKIPEPDIMLYLSGGGHKGYASIELPAEPSGDEVIELVKTLYSEAKNDVYKHGSFALPFFARFAVELFDGTFTLQSVPTLLFPCVRANYSLGKSLLGPEGDLSINGKALCYRANYDYSDWSDIVNGVSVFVTRGVEVNDFEKKWTFGSHPFVDSVGMNDGEESYSQTSVSSKTQPRSDADIIRDLKDIAQIFYKIADLGKNASGDRLVSIRDGILENITSQERLKDDYFSHCNIGGTSIMTYNNRLIVSNITRNFYKGATRFVGYSSGTPREVTILVGIESENGDRVIENTFMTTQYLDLYFFYPDPRARWVKMIDGDQTYTYELTQHPFLNGSYFLRRLPGGDVIENSDEEYVGGGVTWGGSQNSGDNNGNNSGNTNTGNTGGTGRYGRVRRRIPSETPVANEEPEKFTNQIYISEVNNPWNFDPIGNITAGLGEIIGLSTVTKAISQGQFGQYPLVIFATDGIWAASLNAEGVFIAVHPMSREVCNNIDSITQTDAAIFFSSEKGLMVILEDNVVKCVSEQLHSDFPKFLKYAHIAYDYRDSLLWIMSKGICENYVYNIKTGTISTGNYFYNIDEQVGKQKTGTRRAPSLIPGREQDFKTFNGMVAVDNVSIGEYDEDELYISVSEKVVNAAEIYSWTISDIPRFVAAVNNGTASIYRKWELFYTVDRDNILSDIRYRKQDDLEEGDIVSCGDAVYKLHNGVFETISEQQQKFDEYVFSYTQQQHDERFNLSTVKAQIQQEHPGAVFYNSNINVVFDYSVDRFMLQVVLWYDLPDGTWGVYRGFYTSWDAISEKNIVSSDNYMNGSAVRTDTVFYRLSDDGVRLLYLWGYSEDEEKDTLISADNYDVTSIEELIDSEKIIDGQSIDYNQWLDSLLQEWKESALESGISLDEWRVSEGGDIVFNKNTESFVERRIYSYVWQGQRYNGSEYYDEFDNMEEYELDPSSVFVSGDAYYKWNGEDLVLWKSSLTSIVNNYPDTLFFKQGDGLYSLLNRPQQKDDENLYSGMLVTRPIKFENGLALKSIMQLRHVKQMAGLLSMTIKGSNDLQNWRQITSLKGTPWRYYQFTLNFTNMKATDRYSGMVLEVQERRTNRLR